MVFSATVRPVGIIENSRLRQDLSGSSHHSNLSTSSASSQMLSRVMSRTPHVCIVGAGVAGLRCADVLLQHGMRVTILEGRNRIGGRLCQAKVDGHLVDLGANWIHGTDNNPILDLVESTKTGTHSWDGRQAIFDSSGMLLPSDKAAALSEHMWNLIGQAMAESNKSSASIPADRSLFNYFEDAVKDLDQDAETFLGMTEMWGAFVGSPVQRQSLKFFWLEECIDGENLFVAETYAKVLEQISEPALKGAKFLFNKTVTSIVSKESGSSDNDTVISVQTSDNETLHFDHVVMTAPLGWLKRNGDAFTPQLPPRLTEAIDSISYGTLDKVYISFSSAWWDHSPTVSSSSKNDDDNNKDNITAPALNSQQTPNVTATTAPLHQAPNAPPAEPSKHFPGFTQWPTPNFTPSTNPERWSQECVNLASLPPQHAHPTLLFYVFGPTSLHLSRLVEEANSTSPSDATSTPTTTTTTTTTTSSSSSKTTTTTSQPAQKALSNFFTPYLRTLPNYDPNSPRCVPTDILHTNWASDDLAGRGSYCNFQVGLERGDEDIQVMREGLPERRLWFAGEHVAPFVALGTVTGAYWAGESVARRIAGGYGGSW